MSNLHRKEPLISVIVPVYKVEQYLNKCVDSIINQTYKNLEIILVDDGSPDNCGKICDEYAGKDLRIRVIHKENGGLSDARNAGLDIANGEYIGFIDSDDYIAPEMYEKLYKRMLTDKSDIAVCPLLYVNEYDSILNIPQNNTTHEDGIYNAKQFMTQMITYVTAVNKLYKKFLWDNIRFPFGKLHEDEYVFHRITEKCHLISYIASPMYYYVQHNISIMNNKFNIKRLDIVGAYMDRIDCLLNNNWLFAAERTMQNAITLFFTAHKKLDLINTDNRKALFALKKDLKRAYFKLLKHNISNRKKLSFSIFFINPWLYKFIIYILETLNRNLSKMKKYFFIKKFITYKPAKPLIFVVQKVKSLKFNNTLKAQINHIRKNNDFCIFILATPCHGNLGDHAIVCAEYELLNRSGYKDNVIEISNNQYYRYKDILKKHIAANDTIIIDGGGSMGTLWPREDDKISEIIDTYKNNKIIVFPQTCFYDNSNEGKERLIKNQAIYKNAKNLAICLRDKKSYDFCVENFKDVTLEFIPDIVLSLDKSKMQSRQNKVLLCFREDLEKVISNESIKGIYACLDKKDIKHEKISTIYHTNVHMAERTLRLNEIWGKLSDSKLLLTDRLHGMLFAAITGTPCLALDNKSKKVSGVYEWIAELDYIKVCSSADEMIELIPEFYSMGGQKYNTAVLAGEFDILKKILKE